MLIAFQYMFPTHTYYSFKYGTLSPEEVLEAAMANDYEVVALADINSTAGSINFVRMAYKKGIKPVLGIDFRNGAQPCFVAFAKNNEGFKEINVYLSQYLHSGEAIPTEAPPFENAFVIYPFSILAEEVKLRANEFVGVHHRDLVRLSRSPLATPQQKLLMCFL